jgi:integrase
MSKSQHPGVSLFKPNSGTPGRRIRWRMAWIEPGSIPPKRQTTYTSYDRKVAERCAVKLSERLERIRTGLISPKEARMLEATKFAIERHLEDFRRWLASIHNTPKEVGEINSRLKKIIAWCEFKSLQELNAPVVQAAISSRCGVHGLSARTANSYLKDAKRFGRWLKRDGRLADSPFEALKTFNQESDRRLVRRALNSDELSRLLAATGTIPMNYGLCSADREMLYRLAVTTGLRKSELCSLTPESFALETSPASVTVKAGYSKHRRTDVQPLRADVAAVVRSWLESKEPALPVFKTPDKAAVMIRRDLEAAGIKQNTDAGNADFHSLRHTFISLLASSGADIGSVRELARHSDLKMTQRYVHAAHANKLRALDSLPALAPVAAAQAVGAGSGVANV